MRFCIIEDFNFIGENTMEITKEVIKAIMKKVENGSTYKIEIRKAGLNTAQWYRALNEYGIETNISRGRKAVVYTPEKVKIVRERVKKGEFINKICTDLGMDYKNFCRYCRKIGVKIMTKALLKQNYKNRDYSRSGRKAGKKTASVKASAKKTVEKKKPAKKVSKKK